MRRILLLIMILLSPGLSKAQDDTARYATNSMLSEGKWVKIRVEKAGLYQITNSSLRSMGFSNPANVRLYGLNMEFLPDTKIENINDDLEELPLHHTAEKVVFYARGTTQWTLSSINSSKAVTFTHSNNPYSLYKYYFLTEKSEPSELPAYSYEVADDAPSTDVFPEHALIENDGFSFMNSGRTFFESYDYQNGSSRNYTMTFSSIDSNYPATVYVQFAAAGQSASELYVSAAQNDMGSINIPRNENDNAATVVGKQFTIEKNPPESCNIMLRHSRESGVSGHLDFLQAGYMRKLRLSYGGVLFRPTQKGDIVFHIGGAPANTVIWKITPGRKPEAVAGTLSEDSTYLAVPFTSENTIEVNWKNEELVAFNPEYSFPTPTVVGAVENQDLHSMSNIDLVIVTPASDRLTSQAQRLADAHVTYDSIKCAVLNVEKIYNEFSGGTPDATAIRRFMKMLYDNAESDLTKPKNLLLFGDGVWDNRMVTSALHSKSQDDYLLCYESENSVSPFSSYVMEDYFALVDDNVSSNLYARPRIGVGRIPATTMSEAKGVVDKLIRYMSNDEVGSWKNLLCFICDDGNNNLHMQDGEEVIKQTESLYPSYLIKRIYLDTYERETTATGSHYPSAEADVDKQMHDGAVVMNYTGHGGAEQLAHEQLIQNVDFQNWNYPRLPLWFTAACDVAPFDQNKDNIAETTALNPDGAGIAFIGTTRTVYSTPNKEMNLQYMKYVLACDDYGRQYTIGEAMAKAKQGLISIGSSANNRLHFVLLGDPAIRLATPKVQIVIDEINGVAAEEGMTESVLAGETMTVSGHIENGSGLVDDTFNGQIHTTVLDNLELVTCRNNPRGESNGNTSTTPYTFYDRTKTLYNVIDSVSNGRFTFKCPVPLDNNYSGENGLLSLYASNNSHSVEAHGRNTQFKIDGTSDNLPDDNQGPEIIPIYLNTTNFQNGDVVNETPLLFATISDKDGINMTGSGIGHDIEAMIDNNEATTYSLNSYFTPTVGDYTKGSVQFSIPELEDGHHTLTLRAFDILNNSSSSSIDFYVNNGEKPKIFSLNVSTPVSDKALFIIENDRPQTNLNVTIQVFDVSGRLLYTTKETNFNSSSSYTFSWDLNATDTHLVPGIYIVKAGISTSSGPLATESSKFIVVEKK